MSKSINKRKLNFWIQFFIFVIPAFTLYTFFIIIPLFMSVSYSLYNWNPIENIRYFTSFNNYIKILKDEAFINSIIFTIKYSLVMIVIVNISSLFLAVAIESGIKARNLVRSLFFIPNVISSMLVALAWKFIFLGLYPEIVTKLGLEGLDVNWFASGTSAFWTIIIVAFWQALGFHVILYIAGLQMVPNELYEAANVDGATRWQKIKNVTIPLIAPTITINLFISISGAFHVFDAPMALTMGGPLRSTESIAFNIYSEVAKYFRFGYGSTKSVLLMIMVALVTFLQIRITSRKEVSL